jgi:DDE family transposase
MERELWRWIVWGLRRLPRWWPRGGVYDNRVVLAVLLWAALHDRSISWACRRAHWPVQAWRRCLPDQSTMSRRLRDARVLEDLARLVAIVQRPLGQVRGPLIVDGKPLAVSGFSADPDAANGWGAGCHALGYKLHALVDSLQRLVAFEVQPMNEAECTCARTLLERAAASGLIPRDGTLIGDASYDSNPLHHAAAQAGLRLIAPRRRPELALCSARRHHPNRLAAIRFTEHDPGWEDMRKRVRTTVERYFGTLATVGGGLFALPTWARRLHRVRAWVAAKLALNAARHTLRHIVAA